MKVHLITYTEVIKGSHVTLVSHGVGEDLRNVILPQDPVSFFRPKYDSQGAYIETEDKKDDDT